ncbi:MAG: dihydrofolate reductase [Lachnospiraceae bacterium]|uniref:dihydrofolate reductase n=1 Tax=Candidatus Weimeria bifida TaxID=2599074 RepID=A0A6N7J409_9FIRM|nr:dihydrofolate reductase [Candidatus Weimeria bifida]RRF97308.1 MAG: dihydrofolate reductase [Lachnospiraceae bacterium]
MKAIAAVDKNWGIGYQGRLLTSIPNDMQLFKNETTGNVVVMGRKTLESFPGRRPLPHRTNIVLTTFPDYKSGNAIIVPNLNELFETLKDYDSDKIYVIGGESIYRQLLPYCDKALITKIDMEYDADAFFPNLDKEDNWKMTGESEEQTYFDLCYTFTQYTNGKVKTWTSQEED